MSVSEHTKDGNRAKTKRTLQLLQTAVEVRQGAYRVDDVLGEDANDIRFVSFSMLRDGPLCKAVVINGALFVSSLDAATMDGRDKARMLVVARVVSDA